MRPTLSKHDALGIALQSAFGTPNLQVTWIPITAQSDFGAVEGFEVLQAGDMSDWEYLTWTKGTHYTGTLGFAPMPGLMSLFSAWVLNRDAYNQPMYATIGIHDSGVGTYAVQDVIVDSCEWTFTKGQVVTQSITAHGRKRATSAPSPPTPEDVVRGLPYLCREIVVAVDWGGGYTQNFSFEEISIRVETQAENPEEGYRLCGEPYPHVLYTTGGIRVSGSLTRDFVDDLFFTRLEQMMASPFDYSLRLGIKVTATRSSAGCVWELPCVQLMDYSSPFAADTSTRRTERIDWRAFTDETGETPPLIVTAS